MKGLRKRTMGTQPKWRGILLVYQRSHRVLPKLPQTLGIAVRPATKGHPGMGKRREKSAAANLKRCKESAKRDKAWLDAICRCLHDDAEAMVFHA